MGRQSEHWQIKCFSVVFSNLNQWRCLKLVDTLAMSGGALRVSGTDVTKSELESQESVYVPPATLFDTLWSIVSWYGERPFLGTRPRGADGTLGSFQFKSYSDVWRDASHLGAGLIHLGLAVACDFIGISSSNRAEWVETDFATVMYRFVCVPIAVTVELEVLAFMINQTEMRVAVISADMVAMFAAVASRCPSLRGVVVMDKKRDLLVPNPERIAVHWLEDVKLIGSENFPGHYAGQDRKPEELWSIIYTSGSTGMPKGAMMSDKRWNQFVTNGYAMPNPVRLLSFAPLAHVSERQLTWICAFYGGCLGMYSGDMCV